EHFADEPCTVDIDPGRFRQIVSNLVGNALKFTPSGGSITVRTTQGDGQCWIEVADTGRGIPEDQFDAVFDRLHQVTEGDQVVGGLGIGLNVCREIARMHRGDILVESELGKGSVFRVLVPAAVANGEGEGERVGSEEAEIAPQFA
ncbi:MAG: ATP-binding protein, partial [Planctomycetota bacterium]